jgi:hypothetical protein
MSRPATKEDLLKQAEESFEKLLALIAEKESK